jgi:hypothetical protein
MNRTPDVGRWFEETGHPLDATMRRAHEIILGAEIPGDHPRLEDPERPRGRHPRVVRLEGRLAVAAK